MNKLGLVCTSVVIGVGVLFPVQAQADPYNPCFASDMGAGVENKSDHYNWAASRSVDAVASNLAGKVAMVFNCSSVSGDQLARAFGQISRLIAQRAPDVRCFNGDEGVLNTDAAGHESWARTKSRTQVRDNLAWKSAAAIRCLDAAHNRPDFFAEESVMLARVPGSAPSAPPAAGPLNCNGQWAVRAVSPVRAGSPVTINYSAPADHQTTAWIGLGVDPGDAGRIWDRVPAGSCGSIQLKAPPTPGVYYAYIYPDNGYGNVGSPDRVVVDP
jgi:hypothetical protein